MARQIAALLICLAVTFAVAAVGGLFTARSVTTWYRELQRPSWTPPAWVFRPVWMALYVMMAVAAWLVWRATGLKAGWLPLALFAAQLVLNAAWSGIFFGLRMPGAAFAEIVVLWAAIAATTVAFWRATPWAGVLMLPYLAWVGFAAALNYQIWRLNA